MESDAQVLEIEANVLRGLAAVQDEALAFQKTFPIGSDSEWQPGSMSGRSAGFVSSGWFREPLG
jgi:hypothetical protein